MNARPFADEILGRRDPRHQTMILDSVTFGAGEGEGSDSWFLFG